MFESSSVNKPGSPHVQPNRAKLIDAEKLLEKLVNIDSTTAEIAAVNRVQDIVSEMLTSLGFQTRTIENPSDVTLSGKLLIAEKHGSSDRFVTFVSHVDTVLSLADTGKFARSKDGLMAKGSGVIDNKGGIVVLLKGLETFLRSQPALESFSLRVVISPNEEAGSIGFHPTFRELANDSFLVLGFEPALEDGSIVESRRGNRWYLVDTVGQEAHAGRCRGEELNAAHDIAIKISRLQKLNRRSHGENVNVGLITGGRDRYNVVCGHVTTKLDVRFASFRSRDRLHRKIEKILLKPAVISRITGLSATTTYKIVDDCPPFSTTPASKKYLKLYLKRVSKIEGRKIVSVKAGGAGDVNYMSREQTVIFDGLGPVGGKMHTVDEYISLSSLASRSLALAEFLARVETL